MRRIYSPVLDENLYIVDLGLGCTLWAMPQLGARQTMAQLQVGLGALHAFGGESAVGIAHLIEHLLFQKESGDITDRFAALGCDINASTGLECTEFSLCCGQAFEEPLDLLFELVFDGYMSDVGLQREREIILSEINLYRDDPEWVAYYGGLVGAYGDQPIAREIAGEAALLNAIKISELRRWHAAYYRPANTCLFLSGSFSIRNLTAICQKALQRHAPSFTLHEGGHIEPLKPVKVAPAPDRVKTRHLPLRGPQAHMVFPARTVGTGLSFIKRELALEIFLDMAIGPTSDAYVALYENGLIGGDTFSAEVYVQQTYGYCTVGVETPAPDDFVRAVQSILANAWNECGFSEDLQRARRKMFGRLVRSFETPEGCLEMMSASYVLGGHPFEYIEAIDALTLTDVERAWNECFFDAKPSIVYLLPLTDRDHV